MQEYACSSQLVSAKLQTFFFVLLSSPSQLLRSPETCFLVQKDAVSSPRDPVRGSENIIGQYLDYDTVPFSFIHVFFGCCFKRVACTAVLLHTASVLFPVSMQVSGVAGD